jgi:NAD(P)-dependent dehydrogenase (short-subunit alcohol dehydrogenase family)
MPHPVTLITGASRGLGRALARFLAHQGHRLVLTARGKGALEAVREELGSAHVTALAGDVGDPAHRRSLVEAAEQAGGLSLLVNNASTLGPSPLPLLERYPLEALRSVYEVNVVAPLALVQLALPQLRKRNGTVVNLSSDAATGGYATWGGYGSSKAALDLLTKTLAAEVPEVAFVSVDPGDMRTQMHQEAFPGEDISDRPEPEATLPFWAWLLAQEPTRVSGQRFRAQTEVWEVPA